MTDYSKSLNNERWSAHYNFKSLNNVVNCILKGNINMVRRNQKCYINLVKTDLKYSSSTDKVVIKTRFSDGLGIVGFLADAVGIVNNSGLCVFVQCR